MTNEMYIKSLTELDKNYKRLNSLIHKQYFRSVVVFKIGEYVRNITGIIKITEITYSLNDEKRIHCIIYKGIKYHLNKGVLVKTKNQDFNCLYDYLDSSGKRYENNIKSLKI